MQVESVFELGLSQCSKKERLDRGGKQADDAQWTTLLFSDTQFCKVVNVDSLVLNLRGKCS